MEDREFHKRLEEELKLIADDPELYYDLMKLKRKTQPVAISAQNSLAQLQDLTQDDDDSQNKNLLIDSGHEKAAKSIAGTITNN